VGPPQKREKLKNTSNLELLLLVLYLLSFFANSPVVQDARCSKRGREEQEDFSLVAGYMHWQQASKSKPAEEARGQKPPVGIVFTRSKSRPALKCGWQVEYYIQRRDEVAAVPLCPLYILTITDPKFSLLV
jgi:hypothetical protein